MYVWAVMVKLLNAAVTEAAVFGTQWLDCSACVTQLLEWIVALFPLIKVGHLNKQNGKGDSDMDRKGRVTQTETEREG